MRGACSVRDRIGSDRSTTFVAAPHTRTHTHIPPHVHTNTNTNTYTYTPIHTRVHALAHAHAHAHAHVTGDADMIGFLVEQGASIDPRLTNDATGKHVRACARVCMCVRARVCICAHFFDRPQAHKKCHW